METKSNCEGGKYSKFIETLIIGCRWNWSWNGNHDYPVVVDYKSNMKYENSNIFQQTLTWSETSMLVTKVCSDSCYDGRDSVDYNLDDDEVSHIGIYELWIYFFDLEKWTSINNCKSTSNFISYSPNAQLDYANHK